MNLPAETTPAPQPAIIEQVLIKGDLSRLTAEERTAYVLHVCRTTGLNPASKPFDYIVLNGKLVLYANRSCTDQLRTIHNVSVEDLTEVERDGLYIVTAKVKNGSGRTDMAKGAVYIGALKGEALANAIMKAETKSKRRATLSICGLGFLDETEIEDIPTGVREPTPRITKAQGDELITLCNEKGKNPGKLIEKYGAQEVGELTIEEYADAKRRIEQVKAEP